MDVNIRLDMGEEYELLRAKGMETMADVGGGLHRARCRSDAKGIESWIDV